MFYSLLDSKAYYRVNKRETALLVANEPLYKTKAVFHNVFHLISTLVDMGI